MTQEVVLSTWTSLDDWRKWSGSQERAELENELTPHLKEALKVKLYITGAEYRKETFT